MAGYHCSHCDSCTESIGEKLIYSALGAITFGFYWVLVFIYQLFDRRCPACDHPLKHHAGRRNGK